jgi:hypothetical protein
MSTCTVCNQPSNISVKLPRFAPDRRAAYVQDVCRILIESRMGPAAVWIDAEEPPLPLPDPFAADAPLLDFRSRFFALIGEAFFAFSGLWLSSGVSRLGRLTGMLLGEWLGGWRCLLAPIAQRFSASCLPRGSPICCTLRNAIIGVQGGTVWDATHTYAPRCTQMRISKKSRLAALFAGKLACPVRGTLICGCAAAENRRLIDIL